MVKISVEKVKKKISIPLHGNKLISFDKLKFYQEKKKELYFKK